MSELTEYRFSFGPWNISEGADPFGPEVRQPYSLVEKLDMYGPLGFAGVQFHDDDVVEEIDDKTPDRVLAVARDVKKMLDDRELVAEFVAPRLWFHPRTIDGAYTSNNAQDRQYAIDRSKQMIDIAREIGCHNVVLWLAREGTYIRESKDGVKAIHRIREAIDAMLEYDKEVNIWIEPKPNEPVDSAFIPTIGYAIALGNMTIDPSRMGGLIETAHSLLAGLDPADDMAFALACGKLRSVHLNDQGGLKFDQDKSFGSNNLRSAFNQVRVLEESGFGRNGEFVGLDVKVMRTQWQDGSTAHLANSRQTFMHVLEKVRTLDVELERQYIEARDYESLDNYILRHLMGV